MDLIGVIAVLVLVSAGIFFLSGDLRRRAVALLAATGRSSTRTAPDQRAIVEAVAMWTENLRDTMSAASGLEQAIISTEGHAPRAISGCVQRLVASLRYGRLDDALRQFADDVSHPTCDFVVAALIASSLHQTRDVTQLLGHLSDCARAECDLYLRIWVSRARSRAAVRIITAAVGVFAGGLLILNPEYLAPFVSMPGAIVFACLSSCFVGAIVWLNSMARVRTPARFLSGRASVVA